MTVLFFTVGYASTIRFKNKVTGRKDSRRLQFPKSDDEALTPDDIVDNLISTPSFPEGSVDLHTENIKGLHTNLTRKLSIQ